MGISKSGCSSSITKEDLENMYKQGFVEGYKHCQEILTAYDVEAVVKQIEEFVECNDKCRKTFYQGRECRSCAYKEIIEIVRKGGLSDE